MASVMMRTSTVATRTAAAATLVFAMTAAAISVVVVVVVVVSIVVVSIVIAVAMQQLSSDGEMRSNIIVVIGFHRFHSVGVARADGGANLLARVVLEVFYKLFGVLIDQ